MNEKENIIEELEKMKDDIEDMEFACAVMSRKIDDLINEYRRKEGRTPANLDRLYTLLNDQAYKLQELKRNTWNAISAAEEGVEYYVIKLKAIKSEKNLAYIHKGKASETYIRRIADFSGYFGIPRLGINPYEHIDVVGVDKYKTRQEAENAKEEYEEAKGER